MAMARGGAAFPNSLSLSLDHHQGKRPSLHFRPHRLPPPDVSPVSVSSRKPLRRPIAASTNDAAVVMKPGVEHDAKRDPTVPGISEEAPEETSASSFLSDVVSLIKLVDSRDIAEVELKHPEFEIVIRKKEATTPPPAQAPVPMPAPAPGPTQAPPSIVSQVPRQANPKLSPKVQTPLASLPAMLSPMAGTLYRSPAPGEPAFVKVGDKVQKGQIVCIIEAMKLMNEIEADRTGTIVEILAEDGKPVGIDSPIMVIKP